MTMDVSKVLYCECAWTEVTPEATRRSVLAALENSGVELVAVPDLCKLAADHDPVLADLAQGENVAVVACYPRAVRWLFHLAEAKLRPDALLLNMREESAEEITKKLFGEDYVLDPEAQPLNVPVKEGDWLPWFPVIDYDRCVDCKQCLSFCLFGAYAEGDDGVPIVFQPDACKTFCPACSRICPEAAIIFPKLKEKPLNGAEVSDEKMVRTNAKVNVEQFLGDDPYAALVERRKKAKTKLLKTRNTEQAETERKTCMAKDNKTQ